MKAIVFVEVHVDTEACEDGPPALLSDATRKVENWLSKSLPERVVTPAPWAIRDARVVGAATADDAPAMPR